MRLTLAVCLLPAIVVGQQSHANFTISPATVALGKTYSVTVRVKEPCEEAAPPAVNLKNVSIEIKTTGFTKEAGNPGAACFQRFTLSVASDAPLGPVDVALVETLSGGGKRDLSPLTLQVMSKERGATPMGIPESEAVEVMWKVLPRRVVSDSYGRRVAQTYFGVEVSIGNNSGYDLQISNVGFKLKSEGGKVPRPNDSYNSVRGTLEREQIVGKRAIVVGSMKAAGGILTGINGFLGNSVNRATQANYSTFVNLFTNPAEKGLELIWPDRTVRQLISLDARAMRDHMIIHNNRQERLLVFVSRELVMCKPGGGILVDSQDMTACGETTQDKRLKYYDNFDPLKVMEYLNELVLVGRPIYYLQRMHLSSEAGEGIKASPLVNPTSELKITQGESDKLFALSGNVLNNVRLFMEQGAPVDVTDVQIKANGSVLTFKAAVPKWNAPLGVYKLNVSNFQTLDFEVLEAKPKVTSVAENSLAVPATATAAVAKTITVQGEFLNDIGKSGVTVTAPSAAGAGKITVTGVSATPANATAATGHSLAIGVSAAVGTPAGTYKVELKRPGGSKAEFNLTVTAQ